MESDSILLDAAKGALAGAAATWLMGKVTTYLYEHENRVARHDEEAARGGQTAYASAAQKAAGLVGKRLDHKTRESAGMAVHWSLGAAGGAAYGILRHRVPGIDAAMGLGFGLGFFLVFDELLPPALGLTPGPTAFPWQTHARGLAGHLAYGLTAETLLEATDLITNGVG